MKLIHDTKKFFKTVTKFPSSNFVQVQKSFVTEGTFLQFTKYKAQNYVNALKKFRDTKKRLVLWAATKHQTKIPSHESHIRTTIEDIINSRLILKFFRHYYHKIIIACQEI